MNRTKVSDWLKSLSAYGAIVVFIIMAFEVMIMISPFAFFFYSVFNPIFRWLDQSASTSWLTAFFLPHMVVPPTPFLTAIRIVGSLLFVAGALVFLSCAFQVYFHKIFKKGVALKGLYAYIRHPQYLALGTWGIGMAILWPRFIVLATLSLMFVLYYFLAKNEEQRMLCQYGAVYEQYRQKTGMFFPRGIEKVLAFPARLTPAVVTGYLVIPLGLITITLGMGFLLREITLQQLPLESKNNITLLTILPEDNQFDMPVLGYVTELNKNGKISFLENQGDYLGYLMTPDYVMQGMIANTDSEFHLYKQHHTVALISDWVLHPFSHLRRSPSEHMAAMHNVSPEMARRHHCPLGINQDGMDCRDCPYRRVIFVRVVNPGGQRLTGRDLFSFYTSRRPVGFLDINVKTGEIVNLKAVEATSAWQEVPTPAF